MALVAGAVSGTANAHDYDRWGGLYIGASVGGQWSDISGNYVLPPTSDAHNSSQSTAIYGGQIGFQHQWNRFVIGVEAAVNGTGPYDSWSSSLSPSADCLGSTADRTCSHKLGMLFTVGPRLGFAFSENFMLYGTGGFAMGNLRTRTSVTSTGVETSASGVSHDGWFAGGGIEYALTRNWIVGVEYKHLDFDSTRHLAGASLSGNSRDMSFTTDIVQARLSFKLGRPTEVYESMK